MEGIWNNIKQKLQELKKDKNAALRKCMGILLAGICLLVILWPSDKKNGFSGLDALTGTKQDKTSGGVTGKQQNGEYASDNGQGISGEESSANSGYEDYIAFQRFLFSFTQSASQTHQTVFILLISNYARSSSSNIFSKIGKQSKVAK